MYSTARPEHHPLFLFRRREIHERCLKRHFFEARATARSIVAYLAAVIPSPFIGVPSAFSLCALLVLHDAVYR
jgi:hypothetical protein